MQKYLFLSLKKWRMMLLFKKRSPKAMALGLLVDLHLSYTMIKTRIGELLPHSSRFGYEVLTPIVP